MQRRSYFNLKDYFLWGKTRFLYRKSFYYKEFKNSIWPFKMPHVYFMYRNWKHQNPNDINSFGSLVSGLLGSVHHSGYYVSLNRWPQKVGPLNVEYRTSR